MNGAGNLKNSFASINLEKSVDDEFVKNLGGKDKQSLADNGLSPYQELFCRIFRSDFFTNLSSVCTHQTGEKQKTLLNIIFNTL